MKPKVKVISAEGKSLRKGKDYKVTYSNNIMPGNATIKIEGIGDFSGTIVQHFIIAPKKISKVRVSNPIKGKIRVAFTKSKGTRGYQIQYSSNISFSSSKTTSSSSNSVLIKGKKGKVLYIRVRPYVIVNGGKVYGEWSIAKKIKINK